MPRHGFPCLPRARLSLCAPRCAPPPAWLSFGSLLVGTSPLASLGCASLARATWLGSLPSTAGVRPRTALRTLVRASSARLTWVARVRRARLVCVSALVNRPNLVCARSLALARGSRARHLGSQRRARRGRFCFASFSVCLSLCPTVASVARACVDLCLAPVGVSECGRVRCAPSVISSVRGSKGGSVMACAGVCVVVSVCV